MEVEAETGDSGSFQLAPDQQPTFIGFVFDSPVSAVNFYYAGNDTTRFGLDELEAFSVPEPATMSLLALGGLGVLVRGRRSCGRSQEKLHRG